MIVEWLVGLATGMVEWVVGLFPDWEVPEWFTDADGILANVYQFFNGMSPWVDWAFIGVLAAVPPLVWVIGLTIRALRVLIGHIPLFGGKG